MYVISDGYVSLSRSQDNVHSKKYIFSFQYDNVGFQKISGTNTVFLRIKI